MCISTGTCAALSALIIRAATVVIALGLGVRARAGRTMSLEQWTIGGRGFGFLLLAGEIYTTFTFLGGSGYACGKTRRHVPARARGVPGPSAPAPHA
jgi:hypothetical protein